jgi:hypothetical protein
VYVVAQADESFVTDPERCIPPFPGSAIVGVLLAYDGDGTLLWTRRIKGGARTAGYQFTGAKTVWASEAGVFVAANLTTTFAGALPDGSRSDRSECPGVELGNPFYDQFDAYVRRYDFNGDVIWTHQFGSNVFDIVTSLGTDATSVYAVGETGCRIDEDETFSGAFTDSFVARIAIEPSSLPGQVQLIVGRLETLSDAGLFTPGAFNSLVTHLEAAFAALDRGSNPVAERHLEAFVTEVGTLESRGGLSFAEAAGLVAAANAVIAQL